MLILLVFFHRYLGATVAFTCLILLGSLLFTIGGYRASQSIHKDTMSRMLQAPYSWYQNTPQGRITSRFTTDLGVVDIQLSLWNDNLAQMGSQYLAMAGLVVYVELMTCFHCLLGHIGVAVPVALFTANNFYVLLCSFIHVEKFI